MYEQYFEFKSRPFYPTPFVEHYFPTQTMQRALFNCRTAIERGAGPVLIVGETGTGKSLALAILEKDFRDKFHVVSVSCSRMSQRQEFLQTVLFELNLPYRGLSEGELRLSLLDFLRSCIADRQGLLLLIDDGDQLSVEVLDEIRLISNFSQAGQPRARVVMAGTVRLEELISDPRVQSLNQRIAARNYLSNLNSAETGEYILEHLHRAGADANRWLDRAGLECAHELTEGCPRLINQLCDQAMILCMTQGERFIDANLLREAWSDLQCFPNAQCNRRESTPGSGSCPVASQWAVIEFGKLDEEAEFDSVGTESESGNWPAKSTSAPSCDNLAKSNFLADASQALDESRLDEESKSWFQLGSLSSFDDAYESHQEWSQSPLDRTGQLTGQDFSSFELADRLYGRRDQPPVVPPIEQSARSVAANPFAESFEQVEVVQQRFAPLIAHRNRASQDLTSEDLKALQSWSADSKIDENSHTAKSIETPSPCCREQIDLKSFENISPALSSPVSTNSFARGNEREFARIEKVEVTASDVEREADLLIQKLSQSLCDSVNAPVPVTRRTPNGIEPASDNVNSPSAPFTIKLADAPAPHQPVAFVAKGEFIAENTQPQKLENLKQVIEEQNRFSARAFGRFVIQPTVETQNKEWLSASASSISPTANQSGFVPVLPSRQDDRDMIVCQSNEPEYQDVQSPKKSERIPIPPATVSTGRAERMDYQQLFDQLRNPSDI